MRNRDDAEIQSHFFLSSHAFNVGKTECFYDTSFRTHYEPISINLVPRYLSPFGVFLIARFSKRCPFRYFLRPDASKIRSKSSQISSKTFIEIGSSLDEV